ncbi:diguanylate cyclase [Spirochaetia bacterium 38H-sp]|uniref:diguanylate cyclase n=1 Tax=Rarispira pelagica TaxID=3141764 RepID=A0ABU9UBW4_9SPIR
MHKKLIFLISTIFCYTLFAEPIVLSSQEKIGIPYNSIQMYFAGDKDLSIYDIIDGEKNRYIDFTYADKSSYGFNDSYIWLKIDIDTKASFDRKWLLEVDYPLLDFVSMYLISKDKVIDFDYISDRKPFRNRTYQYRNPVFSLGVLPTGHYTVYLKIKTRGTLRFPLYLWRENILFDYSARINLVYGMYMGLLLLLFVIIIIFYANYKLRHFVFFNIFIICAFVFNSIQDGFLFILLSPETTSWKYYFYIISGTIGLMAFSSFMYDFLSPGRLRLMLRYLYYVVYGWGFFTIVSLLFLPVSLSLILFAILGVLFVVPNLISMVSSIAAGDRAGGFALTGFVFFIVGIAVFALRGFGLMPSNVLTLHTKEIGIILLVFVITLGIVDHFNNFRLQSIVDDLTGLYNRRYFFNTAGPVIDRCIALGAPVSFMILDLDHFKNINDNYGHAVGDTALVGFSSALSSLLRKTDIAARIGGEEFAILLPYTDQDDALAIANRIREKIELLSINIDKMSVDFTVSIGVASLSGNINSLDSLIKAADKALYMAKHKGRNKVVSYYD